MYVTVGTCCMYVTVGTCCTEDKQCIRLVSFHAYFEMLHGQQNIKYRCVKEEGGHIFIIMLTGLSGHTFYRLQ
jgi:hypothetical protein